MDYNIKKVLSKVAKGIEGSDKLAVPFLAVKAANHLKTEPQDKTVGALSIILAKMVDNNKTFITREAFRTLYNKHYVSGSRANELFKNELNLNNTLESTRKYAEKRYEPVDNKNKTVLATALSDALSGNVIRNYSEKASQSAIKSVSRTLNIWGLNPNRINIAAGNDKYLVVQADYETPKGLTSVHIPVTVSNDSITESFVFVGNSAPQELNNENLKNYVKSNAGAKLSLTGEMLLNALDSIAAKKTISDAEMALIRINAKRNASAPLSNNTVTGLKLYPEPKKNIERRKYEDTDKFAEKFENPYGKAVLKFSADKVDLGTNIISRELKDFGYTPQIKVFNSTKNSVSYAVSLGSVSFTVPLKIEAGLVQLPTVLMCNGSIKPFSAKTIQELHGSSLDVRASAVTSPLYGLSSGNLIATIKDAVANKNLQKAEDALNVLAANHDKVSYATAIQIYMNALGNDKVAENKCSKMIKTSSHKMPVCSHTGLPIDKIYQDEHGNCRPLYRKSMDSTYKPALSMHHKVFG